jgi:hypothetical protein
LKSTVPETVAVLELRVTFAVSVAEPPKAMVEGETFVVIAAVGQVASEPRAKSCRSAVGEGELRLSKRNLLTQGGLGPSSPVRSTPTSKNSAEAKVLGPEVLSWAGQGVERETELDLAQKLAVTGAVVQSLPPVAVRLANIVAPPTHLNASRVVTLPPVVNAAVKSRSPTW